MSTIEKLRKRFKEDMVFDMHRPHPENTIKKGTMKNIHQFLNEKGLL